MSNTPLITLLHPDYHLSSTNGNHCNKNNNDILEEESALGTIATWRQSRNGWVVHKFPDDYNRWEAEFNRQRLSLRVSSCDDELPSERNNARVWEWKPPERWKFSLSRTNLNLWLRKHPPSESLGGLLEFSEPAPVTRNYQVPPFEHGITTIPDLEVQNHSDVRIVRQNASVYAKASFAREKRTRTPDPSEATEPKGAGIFTSVIEPPHCTAALSHICLDSPMLQLHQLDQQSMTPLHYFPIPYSNPTRPSCIFSRGRRGFFVIPLTKCVPRPCSPPNWEGVCEDSEILLEEATISPRDKNTKSIKWTKERLCIFWKNLSLITESGKFGILSSFYSNDDEVGPLGEHIRIWVTGHQACSIRVLLNYIGSSAPSSIHSLITEEYSTGFSSFCDEKQSFLYGCGVLYCCEKSRFRAVL